MDRRLRKKTVLASFALLFLIALSVFAGAHRLDVTAQQTTERGTMSIINPLTGNSSFTFDAVEYPVNSTFTASFMIEGLTGDPKQLVGLVAWQVYIMYDRRVIRINSSKDVWIPRQNVFEEYYDDMTQLPPTIDVEPDGLNETLKFGAFSSILLQPVTVTGLGLMFQANFTIVAGPPEGQTFISANMNYVRQAEGSSSLDTCVFIAPGSPPPKQSVYTESIQVLIFVGEIVERHDIAVISIVVSKTETEVGENLTITITVQNLGNASDAYDLDLVYDSTSFDPTRFPERRVTNPNVTEQFLIKWNTANWTVGTYTLTARAVLALDENLTNNEASVTVRLNEKLTPFTYTLWLFSMWLSTPFGYLMIIYAVVVVGFFTWLAVAKRIKR